MFNIDIKKYDFVLFLAVCAAAVFGALMVFSASGVRSYEPFLKHIICASIGFVLMCATAFAVDVKFYKKYAPLIYFAAFLGVFLVLFLGGESHGAKRWFKFFGFSLQPSEIAKFALIIITASFISRKREILSLAQGAAAPVVLLVLLTLPIVFEPDLGTPILMAAVWFAMLFCAGINLKPLAGLSIAGAFLIAEEIIRKPYRLARFRVFAESVFNIDAVLDNSDAKFYNLKQSLQAIGNGGLFGQGLGKSAIKLNYLPEAHTDFIFPVACEELGLFLGALPVLCFFGFFFLRGMKIGKNAPDDFSQFLAFGIVFAITFQALINMSMALGVLPTKGMPLPFVSLGGTSLICVMAASGILINISQYSGNGREQIVNSK